jgi:hypothetical protein
VLINISAVQLFILILCVRAEHEEEEEEVKTAIISCQINGSPDIDKGKLRDLWRWSEIHDDCLPRECGAGEFQSSICDDNRERDEIELKLFLCSCLIGF